MPEETSHLEPCSSDASGPATPEPLSTYSLLGALAEVVTERGEDFIYERPGGEDSCYYVWGDEPSCLFGAALYRLGLSLNELSSYDPSGFAGTGVGLDTVLQQYGINKVDAEAFQEAQDNQDYGLPYGVVLDLLIRALQLSS